MTQTSKQNEVLSESCRWWDGSRSSFAEWTAEGGLNADGQVGSDGLSPRYQGKTCDGTSPSGRFSVKLGGTAEVSTFVPREHFFGSPVDEGLF